MRRYFIDAQAMQETDTACMDDRLKTEKVLNQNPSALQELQASSGIRTLILDIQHSASRKLTVILVVLSSLAIVQMSQTNKPHIFQLQLNNGDLPKSRPKGDPPDIFVIIKAVQLLRLFMQTSRTRTLVVGLSGPGKTAAMSVSHPPCSSQYETMARSCGQIHTAVAHLPRITSVHRRAPRRDDTLLLRVGGKEESE